MTTILHSIDTGGPGGAETVFAMLAAASGPYRTIALAKPGGWVEKTLKERGVEARFANTRGSFNREYLAKIIGIIRDNNVALVQSHLLGSNLYCTIAGRLCGVPVVSAFHGAQDLAGQGMALGIKRQLIQRGSTALIAVSQTLRGELITAGFSDGPKLQVVYNGIDIDRFASAQPGSLRTDLGIPEDAPLIGAVGNIRKPKGYEVLISAMALLAKQEPRLHLVIAGQGEGELLESLQRQISDAGLGERVHLPGFVSDTPAFFSSIDIYVSSSHSEGFSLSCVEAMASRTPVVATKSGGPEEIIEDGRTGSLVRPGDAGSLAAAIRQSLAQPGETASRIDAALKAAQARFSVATMVDGYHRIYGVLLTANGTSQ